MKRINSPRRWFLVLLCLSPSFIGIGCGESKLDQMRRHAIRRAPDQNESLVAQAEADTAPPSDEPPHAIADVDPPDEAPTQVAPVASPTGANVLRDVATEQAAVVATQATTTATPDTPDADQPATAAPPLELPTFDPLHLNDVQSRQLTIFNLRRIGQALARHVAEQGGLPATGKRADGTAGLSWRVALLPYLDYEQLHSQFRLDEPWDSPHNLELLAAMPPEYRSPDRNDAATCYLAVVGPASLIGSVPAQRERRRVLADTVAIVVADQDRAVPWTQPGDFSPNPRRPTDGMRGIRENHALVIWGDGAVSEIPGDFPPQVLRAVFSRNDGTIVERDGIASLVDNLPLGPPALHVVIDEPYFPGGQMGRTLASDPVPGQATGGQPVRGQETRAQPGQETLTQPAAQSAAQPAQPAVLGQERGVRRDETRQQVIADHWAARLPSASLPTQPRMAVPSIDERREPQRQFHEAYAEEYQAARNREQRRRLARRLFETRGEVIADAPSYFVLLDIVRQMSILAGDAEWSFQDGLHLGNS